MKPDERLVLILAHLPHLKPEALDIFLLKNPNTGCAYTEFGGWEGKNHKGFLPTCETAMFILCANNIRKRIEIAKYFQGMHFFIKNKILQIRPASDFEPSLSSALGISPKYLSMLTSEDST